MKKYRVTWKVEGKLYGEHQIRTGEEIVEAKDEARAFWIVYDMGREPMEVEEIGK